MKRYPSSYEGAETAPAHCIALLERASVSSGVVLDLGCGRAPLAEPVKEHGFEYVGVDVDAEALAEVEERGFETHRVDLGGSEAELAAALHQVLSGRRIAAIFAADLLEHLLRPDALLRALRSLEGAGSLIVSVPNATHLNVAAKLLLGRWDPTECGLLDDTHIRYFSEAELVRLFEGTGWRQVDVADTDNPESPDQLFPADAPALRPGTPVRDLLRRLRGGGEAHGSTYQFVRRFEPGEPAPSTPYRWAVDPESGEKRAFASVLVQASGAGDERVRGDLSAQTAADFETVAAGGGAAGLNAAIEAAGGRYLLFLDANTRVAPGWVDAFRVEESLSGRVLKAAAVSVRGGRLASANATELIEAGRPLRINALDLLAQERLGPTVPAAYAVPLDAVRSAGLRFETEHAAAAATVFLMRAAELCGVLALDQVTVAVARGALDDAEDELAAVAESLDNAPIILPARSAGRILNLRRAASASPRWRVGSWLRQAKRRREAGRRG